MTVVMRLLVPGAHGCPAANSTIVPSTAAGRVPTAFCDTLMPKKRNCIAYSFGLDGTWDFDKVRLRVHAALRARVRLPQPLLQAQRERWTWKRRCASPPSLTLTRSLT